MSKTSYGALLLLGPFSPLQLALDRLAYKISPVLVLPQRRKSKAKFAR